MTPAGTGPPAAQLCLMTLRWARSGTAAAGPTVTMGWRTHPAPADDGQLTQASTDIDDPQFITLSEPIAA